MGIIKSIRALETNNVERDHAFPISIPIKAMVCAIKAGSATAKKAKSQKVRSELDCSSRYSSSNGGSCGVKVELRNRFIGSSAIYSMAKVLMVLV